MSIHYLNVIILTKMISQFLRELMTHHSKLEILHIKKMLINNHSDAKNGKSERFLKKV